MKLLNSEGGVRALGDPGQDLGLTERQGGVGLKYLLCARHGAKGFAFHVVFPAFDAEGAVPIFK